ncbi:MAG TPA: alpha/beta fold hydrolase [Steroidobacteraceae bacterium]|nr:alpha/beta fold hydrolase [Steroidobacteraceae bacterium]
MAEVEAVAFRNDQGLMLFGSLHTPAKKNPKLPVVVLLSPGVKMRVGPGRLYVPLTELLTSLGHSVLRFDFYGLGDSEGELAETMLADVYNNIEVGRYVDDTLSALNWLQERHGAQRFIVGGLCGGAITAILAAERNPRVEALLSLGMTVTLASNAARPGQYLTRAQLDDRRRRYYSKLLKPQAWLRFLTFRSEYDVIWKGLKRLFIKDAPLPAVAPGSEPPIEQRGNANPLFPKAYFAFLERGGNALMIFSERDRLQSEYEEKFAQPYATQLQAHFGQIEQHVIPHANHVLAFREWQDQMLALSRAWLARLYA